MMKPSLTARRIPVTRRSSGTARTKAHLEDAQLL